MSNEVEVQGLILDENTVSEADYMFGADDKVEIPVNTNKNKFYYNQSTKREPRTNRSCGVFGSLGTLSDLLGKEATEEDLLRLNKLAVEKYGLKIPGGMRMSKAVDCIRNDHNSRNPDNQIYSIRCVIGDKIFAEALKKGHSLVVGYKTSPEYLKDSQDDGVISKDNFPKKGGHLVRTNFNDKVIKIDDNYFKSKKYNTYINNKIKDLKDNGVFFPSAYLFLYKKTMADTIRDNIDLEKAKEMFDKGLWNGLDPRKSMSRQEVMTVIGRVLDECKK